MKPKNGILELDPKEINLPNEIITKVFYEMVGQMKIDLRKAKQQSTYCDIIVEN